MPLKILIIGAEGFLGKSLFINFANDSSFNVVGTSRRPGSEQYLDLNQPHNFNFNEYDVVILCAGMISIQDCEKFRDLAYKTNYESTIGLIDECVNSSCYVIFISSSSVFSGKNSFCTVDDDVEPKSKYGEYKVGVESWIVENHPKDVAILRLTKVIPDKLAPPFVQRWINEIKVNGYTDVYVNHFLSPVTEKEVFNAMKILINVKQGGIFHCGGLKEFSYADYAKDFFKNDLHSLRCLKFVKNGNDVVYNSLQTYLPD